MLIVVSFCDFKFVRENFLFLKTVTGRGIFDICCMFMFLVASGSSSVFNYIVMGCLGVCGVFFIVAGTFMKTDPAGGDLDSKALATRTSMAGAGMSSGLMS